MEATATVSVVLLLFSVAVSHPCKVRWQHLVLSSLLLVVGGNVLTEQKMREFALLDWEQCLNFAFRKAVRKEEVSVILVIPLEKVNGRMRLFCAGTAFSSKLTVLFLPWGMVKLFSLFWVFSSTSPKLFCLVLLSYHSAATRACERFCLNALSSLEAC